MKVFKLYRENPPETHTVMQKNNSNEAQLQGIVFDDGTVVVKWLTKVNSISIFNSWDAFAAIHGHPEYNTKICWSFPGHSGFIWETLE